MAHRIESTDHAFYGSEKPAWHGLGTLVAGQPTSADALRLAKLDWTVEKRRAYFQGSNAFQVADDCYITVRADTECALGIVGARYSPIQNVEAFALADELAGEGGARFESAGSLMNGRRVWMLAALPETIDVQGDRVNQYLLLSNTHDGSGAMEVLVTPVRVVCWNTLSWALSGTKSANRVSVRHTASAGERIQQARKILRTADTAFRATGDALNHLAETKVSARFRDAFLKALVPDPTDDKNRTRAENIRQDIRELATYRQIGASDPAIKGTAYGLYNGLTQWIDRERTTRTTSGRSVAESRLASTWFGSGADLRNRAANLLIDNLQYADADDILSLVDDPPAIPPSILDGIEIASRN